MMDEKKETKLNFTQAQIDAFMARLLKDGPEQGQKRRIQVYAGATVVLMYQPEGPFAASTNRDYNKTMLETKKEHPVETIVVERVSGKHGLFDLMVIQQADEPHSVVADLCGRLTKASPPETLMIDMFWACLVNDCCELPKELR